MQLETSPVETQREAPSSPAKQRLRVALVTEAAAGGVGKHVLDLAAGLAARDADVHVLYSAGRIDGLFRRRVAELDGVVAQQIPMSRGASLQDALAVRSVRRYLNSRGPFDVVHAHSSKAGAVVRLAAWRSGCRVLYTPHCIASMMHGIGPLARFGVGQTELLMARLTDRIICVSPEERDHIAALGVDARRLALIPNGVEPPRTVAAEAVRVRLGIDPASVVVGFVGRLSAQKNVPLLLEAFGRSLAAGARAELVIVGTGPLENELKQRAAELGLERSIHWVGYGDSAEYFGAFDLLVLPSRYEAMPYVPLEAMAAGVPVIATDVGGIRTIIDTGVNGVVVAIDDVDALTSAMAALLGSPEQRQAFVAAGREKAKQFSLEGMIDRTWDLYRSLMNSTPT